MTRIDFYVLPEGEDRREWFACRITEKAYSHGHAVYLQAADAAEAARLDGLLWTFRAGSFVPHRLAGDEAAAPAGEPPVIVAWEGLADGEEPSRALAAQAEDAVLVTLTDEVPLFFSHFPRVVELVAGDERQRAAARARFRFYRDRGYSIQTHEVSATQLQAD
ncbi:DNA polymerase III subunit chi [Ectothiorhodospiraceae bacterium 2226]|nr:DNA polymerase III subunit chi [Ectothiorhodospiraceae bacterium 2226]